MKTLLFTDIYSLLALLWYKTVNTHIGELLLEKGEAKIFRFIVKDRKHAEAQFTMCKFNNLQLPAIRHRQGSRCMSGESKLMG
jgi:hypothetical protein